MLEIRPIAADDEAAVLPMAADFYQGPAVEHPVEEAVLRRAFQAAADPEEPFLDGYLLLEDGEPVGYCYVTNAYSAEVGGRMALVEELYCKPECRGKGYGSKAFAYVLERYRQARRIRLEVSPSNPDAARLYQRLGFRYLRYDQMVLDRNLEE